ncbi:MAG: hypothetical protein ACRES9_06890 [Gammaproteobacteria bacterium]
MVLIAATGAAFITTMPAFAAPTAYFAGFALRGAAVSTSARFPYTLALLKKLNANGMDTIDAAIRSRLNHFHSSKLNLNLDGLGNIKMGQSIAVAFTLNRETTGRGKIGDVYKLYIQLSGAVLFFDFREMSVIATYPVSVEYVDAFDKPPSPAEVQRDIRDMYFGDIKVNLLDDYIKTLASATLRRRYGNRLRVTSVNIAPSALAKMDPSLRRTPSDAREFVAEAFGQALSSNQHVALLPYKKDQAIGNKMALRFANGNVYTLSIPQTDYALIVNVKNFRRIQYEKKSFATGWVYATYATVKLYEPLSGHVYLDSKFRDGVAKIIPENETNVINWPVYQEALLRLFNDVTTAFSDPDSPWATQASNDHDIKEQLTQTQKVMQSCQ